VSVYARRHVCIPEKVTSYCCVMLAPVYGHAVSKLILLQA